MTDLLAGFHAFIRTRDTGYTNLIPQMLADNGIGMLTSESYPVDRDRDCQYEFTANMVVSAPKPIRKVVMAQQGSGWNEERLKKATQLAKEEMRDQKAWIRFEIWCHVGQKKL